MVRLFGLFLWIFSANALASSGFEFKVRPYANNEWLTTKVPGGPQIPFERIVVALPDNTEPSIEVILWQTNDSTLRAALPYNGEELIHSPYRRRFEKNLALYERVYGDEPARIVEVGYAGKTKVAIVEVFPLRYDGRTHAVSEVVEGRIKVAFVKSKTRQLPHTAAESPMRFVLENPPLVQSSNPKRDFVIIHESHRETIGRYLNFKRMMGRTVEELYVSGESADSIKQKIRSAYESETPPNSVFLVGSIDQIPSWRGNSDNNWTDYPYTKLDGDEVPDISLGRVPAQNADELNRFIEKAIARELEPRQPEEILLTAGSDTSLGCPANVTRVGEKFKPAGDDIHVTQKYKTQVGTAEVIAGYNSNPNLIVYDGHGNRSGMTEIPLLISTLNQLKNNVYPIVLDIACLNANWPSSGASSRNFAESILLVNKTGVAGIMASGGSGYGHDFFQTIADISAKSRKNLAEDTKMNEIGQVILAAKIKHGQQDRSYWNYYGDPATSVWEPTMHR